MDREVITYVDREVIKEVKVEVPKVVKQVEYVVKEVIKEVPREVIKVRRRSRTQHSEAANPRRQRAAQRHLRPPDLVHPTTMRCTR